jgi:hypothetical protein
MYFAGKYAIIRSAGIDPSVHVPMAHLVRYEVHADQRYRIVQLSHGFLLSFTLADGNDVCVGPQEWLYRTQEAAETGLDFVVAMNACWYAIASGHPADAKTELCDAAAGEHARAIERLDDRPLMGEALNVFRRPRDRDERGAGTSNPCAMPVGDELLPRSGVL